MANLVTSDMRKTTLVKKLLNIYEFYSRRMQKIGFVIIAIQLAGVAYLLIFQFAMGVDVGDQVRIEIPEANTYEYATATGTVISVGWGINEVQVTGTGYVGQTEISSLLSPGEVVHIPREYLYSREEGRWRQEQRAEIKSKIISIMQNLSVGLRPNSDLMSKLEKASNMITYVDGQASLELINIYRNSLIHENNRPGHLLDKIHAHFMSENRTNCKAKKETINATSLCTTILREIVEHIALNINASLASANNNTLVSVLPHYRNDFEDLLHFVKGHLLSVDIKLVLNSMKTASDITRLKYYQSLESNNYHFEDKSQASQQYETDKQRLDKIRTIYPIEVSDETLFDKFYISRIDPSSLKSYELSEYTALSLIISDLDVRLPYKHKKLLKYLKKFPNSTFNAEVMMKLAETEAKIREYEVQRETVILNFFAREKEYFGTTETTDGNSKFVLRIVQHNLSKQSFVGSITWNDKSVNSLIRGSYIANESDITLDFADVAKTGLVDRHKNNKYQLFIQGEGTYDEPFKGTRKEEGREYLFTVYNPSKLTKSQTIGRRNEL